MESAFNAEHSEELHQETQALQRIASAPPAPAGMFGAVDIQALLEKATTAEAGVEVLERLAVMRREMKAEHAKEMFDQSMALFQAECPILRKDSQVRGEKFSYNYAPLDSIVNQTKALIQKHGFSYRVTAKVEGTNVTAICKVIHSMGHAEESEFQVPIDPSARMNQAQKFASALTFAKRYAFCNAFGILTGDQDDDAGASDPDNAAGHNRPPARPPQQPATRPAAQPATATTQEKPKVVTPLKYPNEAYRKKAIAELIGNDLESQVRKNRLHEFLIKSGCLLPNEPVESWPFEFVPASEADLKMVRDALARFENGEDAKFPFHHHATKENWTPPEKPAKATAADKAKSIEVPRDPDAGDQTEPATQIDPNWEKVTGKIERTSFKEGTKKNGQKWQCWGINIDGDWFNTFSARIGQAAVNAEGKEVDLYFSATERGRTAEHIEV